MIPLRPGFRSFLTLAMLAAPAVSSAQIQVGQPVRIIREEVRPALVQPQVITTTPAVATPTIGSHQIDRFEAIRQLQADLRSDANNVVNWTILGELAHEVALDLPEGQDDAYYKMSREAYERAAALEPANNGLRAAVQFAREQEAGAAAFDAQRRQGVNTYLDARRREMIATGVNPTVMVYETPAGTVTTTTTAPTLANGVPVANGTTVVNGPVTTNPAYPTASYRPYYNAQANQPYSYNQYSSGYLPATSTGAVTGSTVAPTTLRQYGQQLPGVLMNQGVRTIGGSVIPR